jgi:DNA-binding NarL/FixJ family response regulator
MPGFKKVLIADDHAIFRAGLKLILASTDEKIAIDEVTNAQDVCKKVKDCDYDLVILDITMPGRSGLDCLVEIKKLKPNLPAIILSSHLEEQFALRAYKAGASAYLAKGGPTEELLEALRKISMGHKYVSPAMADILIAELGNPQQDQMLNTLSNREYVVLCMIAAGKPVSKIATELSLSVKTISTYRTHILQKLNMKNNSELTRFAIDNHLL